MNQPMKLRSAQFKKEAQNYLWHAQRCLVASDIAAYFEAQNFEPKSYDFFAEEIVEVEPKLLATLRAIPDWVTLEERFKAVKGIVSPSDVEEAVA